VHPQGEIKNFLEQLCCEVGDFGEMQPLGDIKRGLGAVDTVSLTRITCTRVMTKKVVRFLGKNGVHPRRENPGYAYVFSG